MTIFDLNLIHLISICLHNIRDYTTDRHHVCDDTPYGGGGGMVMKPSWIISLSPIWSRLVMAVLISFKFSNEVVIAF